MDTLTHRHHLWSEFRRRIRTAVRAHGCDHAGVYDDRRPPRTAQTLADLGLDVDASLAWIAKRGALHCDCEIAGGLTELQHEMALFEFLEAEQARRDAAASLN